MPLSKEQIDELLGLVDNKKDSAFYTIPDRIKLSRKDIRHINRQGKYVTYSDSYAPCMSRGCKVPTVLRIQNLPYCTMHALGKMDLMLQQLKAEPIVKYEDPPYLPVGFSPETGRQL